MREKALAVLGGRAAQVAGAIRRTATTRGLTTEKRRGADDAARYLAHKRAFLDHPTALERGWPIATGVIEGACRSLVKDRMDITGARWGLASAEAVLRLQTLRANGDFTAYWRFHVSSERRRIHEVRYLNELHSAVEVTSLQESRTQWMSISTASWPSPGRAAGRSNGCPSPRTCSSGRGTRMRTTAHSSITSAPHPARAPRGRRSSSAGNRARILLSH